MSNNKFKENMKSKFVKRLLTAFHVRELMQAVKASK